MGPGRCFSTPARRVGELEHRRTWTVSREYQMGDGLSHLRRSAPVGGGWWMTGRGQEPMIKFQIMQQHDGVMEIDGHSLAVCGVKAWGTLGRQGPAEDG